MTTIRENIFKNRDTRRPTRETLEGRKSGGVAAISLQGPAVRPLCPWKRKSWSANKSA